MMPVDDIKKMRHLSQDWNSLHIMLMSDGSGRHVARFASVSELDSVLNIVKWAVAEYERRESR